MNNVITSKNADINDVAEILKDGSIVMFDTSNWGGAKSVVDKAGHTDIPEKLLNTMSQYIFNSTALAPMKSDKRRATDACLKLGTRWMGGTYLVKTSLVESDLRPIIDATRVDWERHLEELRLNYDSVKLEFAKSQAKHGPEWVKFVEDSQLDWDEVRKRFRFEYSIFKVDTKSLDATAVNSVKQSRDNIYAEVSQSAKSTLNDLLARGSDQVKNSRKNGIVEIATKLRALEFLDPHAIKVANYCDNFLATLPSEGWIKGINLDQYKLFLKSMCDCASIRTLVTGDLGSDISPEIAIRNVAKVKKVANAEVEGDVSATPSKEEQLELPDPVAVDSSVSHTDEAVTPYERDMNKPVVDGNFVIGF